MTTIAAIISAASANAARRASRPRREAGHRVLGEPGRKAKRRSRELGSNETMRARGVAGEPGNPEYQEMILLPGVSELPSTRRCSQRRSASPVDAAGTALMPGKHPANVAHRAPPGPSLRCRATERHGLHCSRVADRDIGQLGRLIHAQVVRHPSVGSIQQHIAHLLPVRGAQVQRQPHRLLAQVHLARPLQGQAITGQQARGRICCCSFLPARPEPGACGRRAVRSLVVGGGSSGVLTSALMHR